MTFGELHYSWHLMGVRDRIRSQVWYNSVGGDQIEIWWVFETGSEINCGIKTWSVSKPRQDDRQQYTFEGRIQWKNTEKTWDKKATSWLTMIVHYKRSTNGHIMYAMIHPSLYLIQIITEWGIFRRQMVCANAGYLLSNPSTGVRRANCFYSSTEKSSAQQFESKTEDMRTTPQKEMGVGSLTTIHRASAYLSWYDTYNVYRRQTWTCEYARNQKTAIKMVDI